ncbi:MAG: HAD-IA family hydrolase [Leucobacter sp.]
MSEHQNGRSPGQSRERGLDRARNSVEIEAGGALLDMDGTLVDSGVVVERIWSAWGASHGLDPARVLDVIHGRQGWQSMAILLPHRSEAENRAENARIQLAERTELDGVVEIPGAVVLMRALVGLPHALVTSAEEGLARARLGAAGLPYPEVAVTAELVSASKPHPEGFLLGAQRLGLSPERCLVFEDSEAGIEAGLAAGMRVIGVGERAAGFGPHYAVRDLNSVRIERAGDAMRVIIEV